MPSARYQVVDEQLEGQQIQSHVFAQSDDVVELLNELPALKATYSIDSLIVIDTLANGQKKRANLTPEQRSEPRPQECIGTVERKAKGGVNADPIDEDVLVGMAILGELTPHSVSEMDRMVRLEQEGFVITEPGPPMKFALTVKGRAVVEAKRKRK